MQLILKVVSGPFDDLQRVDMTQLIHWIGAGQYLTVGRSGFGTDVAVRQDPRMSSVHFRVSCDGQSCRVCDLDSRNGTFVNGERASEAVLRHGDIICAGGTTFHVGVLDEQAAGRLAEADSTPAEQAVGEAFQDAGPTHGIAQPPRSGRSIAAAAAPRLESKSQEEDAMAAHPAGSNVVAAAAEPMQVIIKIASGPFGELEHANMTHMLNWIHAGQSLTVGRTYEADVVVRQDERMSTVHFEVACDGRVCRVRDLASRNGTYVNGRRVSESVLCHGDTIRAGDTEFSIGITGGLRAAQRPAALPQETPVSSPKHLQDASRPAPAFEDGSTAEAGDYDPMQVVLTIVNGPDGDLNQNKLTRLLNWLGAGQGMKVGRSAMGPDMVVGYDEKMSAEHFEIFCDGTRCRLRDLDSRNGTFVNDQRVSEALLCDGDQVLAGRTTFRVAIQGGAPVTNTEAEFAAVAVLDCEPSVEVVSPAAPVVPDLDGVFGQIKSKLKSRA